MWPRRWPPELFREGFAATGVFSEQQGNETEHGGAVDPTGGAGGVLFHDDRFGVTPPPAISWCQAINDLLMANWSDLILFQQSGTAARPPENQRL